MPGTAENPWVLFEQPKPIRLDQDLERQVHLEFVKAGSRNRDSESEISDKLFRTYLADLSPQVACQTALNLFLAINNIHFPVQKANFGRTGPVLNGFISGLTYRTGLEYAAQTTPSFRNTLNQQADALQDYSRGNDVWFFPKLRNLAVEMEGMSKTYEWIDWVRNRFSSLTNTDIEAAKETADSFWSVVQNDKAYGIRNCYFPSPVFLRDNQVFQIIDPNLGLEGVSKETLTPNLFAILGFGNKPSKAILPEVTPYEYRADFGKVQSQLVRIEGLYRSFGITDNGEITTTFGSDIPLRSAFERHNALGVFEFFRLSMYLRLHDLTGRAEIVDQLPSIDKYEREVIGKSRRLGIFPGPIRNIDYKLLVLPRIKDAIPEKDGELDNPEPGERRFVDKHHVGWFTRRLPKGYNASKNAEVYAKEHGVTLLEGETIVRDHDRGKTKGNTSERPRKAKFKPND